jgi:prophage DNA circulation protein
MAELPAPRTAQSITRPPTAAGPTIPNERFRRVAAITDISNTVWRDELMPAHFDRCMFHVESGARESGRRIVVHEFPKRDLPYAEDLGRSAIQFAVRGYCIVYPRDVDANDPEVNLYRRDYRIARNILQDRLDAGGAGTLQLPTYRPVRVVCQHYRMSEEEKLGGYVVFDMQFVEVGAPPFRPVEDTEENMVKRSKDLQQRVLEKLARPHTSASMLR